MTKWLETRAGRIAIVVLRIVIGAVFVYAAIPKIMAPAEFAEAIDNYHVLPADFVGPLAAILPVLELVTAAALIAGVEARGAALVTAGMLAAFTIAMGQAMARGIDLDCGCFGAAARAQVGVGSIARNVALILGCAIVIAAKDFGWRDLSSPRKPNENNDSGNAPAAGSS